jgi:nucleoside-diphosphate-sugar epimerase
VVRKIETLAIFRFVDSMLAGRAIELYNFGHLRRDFTFVEDIVEGIVRLLALPPRGGSAQGRGSRQLHPLDLPGHAHRSTRLQGKQ